MGLAILAFLAIFLLAATGGVILFHRDTASQNISNVIASGAPRQNMQATIRQAGASLGQMVGRFESVLPRSKDEVSKVQQRLIRAGFRKDSAIKVFYGAKVVLPIVLGVSAFILMSMFMDDKPFQFYVMALALGFLGPDFWLGRQISARQQRIRSGLPDTLDMLVICVEAGLSLDQAIVRTTEELGKAHPDMGSELGMVILEQRAGRPRADAWKNMAERTGVDTVRNLVSILVQAEHFGTSIAKTLRVHADTLRTVRVQTLQEKAAKTSVKLVFPLVLFIFPSLFLVTLGPTAILMMESFQNLNH